jgi:hypothetical protein
MGVVKSIISAEGWALVLPPSGNLQTPDILQTPVQTYALQTAQATAGTPGADVDYEIARVVGTPFLGSSSRNQSVGSLSLGGMSPVGTVPLSTIADKFAARDKQPIAVQRLLQTVLDPECKAVLLQFVQSEIVQPALHAMQTELQALKAEVSEPA